MSTPAPAPAPPQEGGGNVLQQRIGPFATWVWLLIATIGVLGYAFLGGRKKQANAQATAGQAVGAQQVPDIIIQNQEGPEQQPPAPPASAVPPTQPAPTPAKPPVPKPGPKPPRYKTISVARWTEKNAPWNSTLWGIAQHEGVAGGWQTLAKLNGIKHPEQIRPGQKIRVPVNS